MTARRPGIAATLLVLLVLAPASARRHHRVRGKPGAFDYWVLSLSWSPRHCATPRAARDPQCDPGRPFGFVAHGLWPQWERGFPESCASGGTLDPAMVESMLDVMPSPALVRHEWAKHGTCSGLDSRAYFAKVRAAVATVTIPEPYRHPTRPLLVSAAEITRDFVRANHGLDEASVAVLCDHRFLQEVRVCVDKSLRARPCGRDVPDRCPDAPVIVPPVR